LPEVPGRRRHYGILFRAAAETLITIAADPRHLGARIGLTAVLHSWGSALTHHPHLHCIVPGGGIAPDGSQWISCRPGFFLPVRVLSRLFRRRVLEQLTAAHQAGRLKFFGEHAGLVDHDQFAAYLTPLRKIEWVVYAKRPFAGPEAVLARAKARSRHKVMTLAADEFIRRFLLHVLPQGFHRIRHYGLFANGGRAENLARARQLLQAPPPHDEVNPDCEADDRGQTLKQPCPSCGGRMIVIETFEPGHAPRAPPPGKADSA
jgi:hypothetical protein